MPSHPISIWRRSPNKLRQGEIWLEWFCFIGLLFAALVLFLINLGDLPLLDLNEATLAQVAKEISQGTSWSNWIFPTLWGEPYLEQPPIVPGLIAIAYKIAGSSEFTTRLPGALLGAASVLILYEIGREIFVTRLPALFSALVYLTCLPVVRFGRLATLDGPLLCFELLTIWAVLRSRRDLRWALVAGVSLGLMSLTKGLLSVQILVIIVLFLWWDTPRLITSAYFWGGLILGAAPGISWYVWEWFRYHELKTNQDFLHLFLGSASPLAELGLPVEYYLIQTLQYFLPWLMVMFAGVKLIGQNIHWGWGRLLGTWLGGYFVLGFLLLPQDYWSVLPLYPALALAAGKQLDLIRNLPSAVAYPRVWVYGFAVMAIVAVGAGFYWGVANYIDFYLPFICGSFAITFAATAVVIAQQEKQFIPLLFWGLFVSIFLLVISPHWIWELKTVEPIEPIANLVRQHTPANTIVYSSMSTRPSLSFYSDRQVVSLSTAELQQRWQHDSMVYLLIDSATQEKLNLSKQAIIKNSQSSSNWSLAIKNYQAQPDKL
ncbi:glycosyltransferase family 39 protein [Pleurocapsales cyanobacterium LEGE 10410]|nr:glycosyltransferase family 39 protein [Pleurocapsales cyanobacterium LEGE 10410]